jgi:hypothetical protein
MLALSDNLPKSWQSANQLKDDWLTDNMGDTYEGVIKYVETCGDELRAKLAFMYKIIVEFSQQKIFSTDAGTFRGFFSLYKFIIARCARLIPNIAMFNRVCPVIIEHFRRDILVEDIQTRLECTSRNGKFQKRLIDLVDTILEEEVDAEGSCRRFSKKAIDEKMAEQKHKCTLCHHAIGATDKYEGDHIIPWTAGGKTIPENLQVVHKRCHQLKSV